MLLFLLLVCTIFICGMLVGATWLIDQDWFLNLVWRQEFEKAEAEAEPEPPQKPLETLSFRKEEPKGIPKGWTNSPQGLRPIERQKVI